MSIEETRAAWDAEAESFDDEPDHGLADPTTRAAWRSLLLDHLPSPPARVADLGCGTGTLSVLLAGEGYDVCGVDLSPAMVARAKAKAEGLPAAFSVGDAASPDLPGGGFDVVLARHVLWALPDPVAGLARWVGLLAPGGRLLLIEGRWSTGAGLAEAEVVAMVRATGRRAVVRRLPDPVHWGKAITDERYLVVSTATGSR